MASGMYPKLYVHTIDFTRYMYATTTSWSKHPAMYNQTCIYISRGTSTRCVLYATANREHGLPPAGEPGRQSGGDHADLGAKAASFMHLT